MVKVVVSNDSAEGASSAAKAPCSARAPKSSPDPVAAPPSPDAIAKPTSPIMKVFFRPTMSAIRPPSSSSPPNASVYAVITHWRFASDIPRSRWAEGRAMFTMLASSTTINCAIAITTSAHQRRGSGSAAVAQEGMLGLRGAGGGSPPPSRLASPITTHLARWYGSPGTPRRPTPERQGESRAFPPFSVGSGAGRRLLCWAGQDEGRPDGSPSARRGVLGRLFRGPAGLSPWVSGPRCGSWPFRRRGPGGRRTAGPAPDRRRRPWRHSRSYGNRPRCNTAG